MTATIKRESKWVANRVFLALILCLTLVQCADEKSCETKCHLRSHPHCGVWSHADNLKQAAGVYVLDSGYANLSCTITSLPKPATVKWLFQAEGTEDYVPVLCDSMRTTSECKFNSLGEHKVNSICILRIFALDQSGVYKCAGVVPDKPPAESAGAKIVVYGIGNFSTVDEEGADTLTYGKAGIVNVHVCGFPKPEVVWVHTTSGVAVATGQSVGNYTALPLHQLIESSDKYEPVTQHKFCYVSRLAIGKVNSTDRHFTVLASNSVEMRRLDVTMRVTGIPVKKSTTRFFVNKVLLTFMMVLLIFHL